VSLERFEVGIVSGDRTVVEFLADVFHLDELPASEHQVGTLHRLRSPGAIIKVMVPKESPTDSDGQPFLSVKGLRYLSMLVTDLDRVIERCIARGGTVLLEAFEFKPGARLAVIMDPDGNTMEVTETG
jgi:catechol 2,3-dioxygenase-like lactoylglutathione lyase family enzyme